MRIALTRPAIAAVMMLSFGAARTAPSREVTRCDNHPPPPPRQTTLFPIAFYSNSTEFAAGGIGLAVGVGQPQRLLGGAAFGSSYSANELLTDLKWDARIGVRWCDSILRVRKRTYSSG